MQVGRVGPGGIVLRSTQAIVILLLSLRQINSLQHPKTNLPLFKLIPSTSVSSPFLLCYTSGTSGITSSRTPREEILVSGLAK